jgi:hypothetical protein
MAGASKAKVGWFRMQAREAESVGWNWVGRAKDCCMLADKFRNPETRDRILKVAVDYEVMALRAAARELAQIAAPNYQANK